MALLHPPAHGAQFINGLSYLEFPTVANAGQDESKMFRVERYTTSQGSQADKLHFFDFPPGSVVVVSVRLTEQQEQAVVDLKHLLNGQVRGRTLFESFSTAYWAGCGCVPPALVMNPCFFSRVYCSRWS